MLLFSPDTPTLPRSPTSSKVRVRAAWFCRRRPKKVIPVKEGDSLALPFGVVTWWHNAHAADLVVLFLGDTSTASPIFSHLAGRTSVWKAISPAILEASFNNTPEMEKLFRSKRLDSEIFFAPSSN